MIFDESFQRINTNLVVNITKYLNNTTTFSNQNQLVREEFVLGWVDLPLDSCELLFV
uniref:Uncharacterized protein n=1 Tax=Wolbachia endosymbiont of Aleurodicus floccissimus TaxID=2152762 RepID=A0A3B0JH37_9RICK